MQKFDMVIVGGGMVGLALAALMKESNLSIAIIDPSKIGISDEISNRVSALNLKSRQMLEALGAWQQIDPQRLSPYTDMKVWEKDGSGRLCFSVSDGIGREKDIDELGFIVENDRIRMGLYHQLSGQAHITFLTSPPLSSIVDGDRAILNLENGEIIITKLLVGADGAHSWVRNYHHFPLIERDYGHSAVVATVRCELPHAKVARQIFASESILAFLPLKDPHLCSIVWSLAPLKAQDFVAISPDDFNEELQLAFDNRLGRCELIGKRSCYPLKARYARDFAKERIALIGDAAHTIHPLAGLGVNLGFSDAMSLASVIKKNLAAGKDIGKHAQLRSFERERKLEAIKVLAMMQALHFTFKGAHPLKKILRNRLLDATNRLKYVKKFFLTSALTL